jgi:NitT/TauT family transport system permease protein
MKKTSFYSFCLFLLLIAGWETSVKLWAIPELILPAPTVILHNLWVNLLSGYLFPHIIATLSEVLGGFMLGSVLGIGLGFFVAQSPVAREILHPYIIASQAMPKIALAPLLVLWFGFGYLPKVIIVVLISFFPLFEATVTGLSHVNQEKLALFRLMRASSLQILLKLRVPTAVPYLFSGLRVAIVLSVVGAVVSEFIGASKGLGALIIVSQGMLDTPLMFSVFILLTAMGLFLYQFIAWIEKTYFKKYYFSRGNG